jgi:oxygen-independent coproporphyrinogen III oxidase
MAGIYLHMPFCKTRCTYCDFYSTTDGKYMSDFTNAIILEIEQRKNYLDNEIINTIYFGGGTPSLFDNKEIDQILSAIFQNFEVNPQSEITIEVNPDDVTNEKAKGWKKSGINRISMGIQSFNDENLKFSGRRHTGKKAIDAFEILRRAAFENISTDIIYGWPNSTEITLLEDLKIFFQLKAEHFSAYQLTVEKGTRLYRKIRTGETFLPDDEMFVNQYTRLIQECQEHGYEQYEISNYARNGKMSQHNTNYWFGVPYIGLGPSAHSFNGTSRRWNINNLHQYMKAINERKEIAGHEDINLFTAYNEFIMTRLRTKWGIDSLELEQKFPDKKILLFFRENSIKLINKQLLVKQNSAITLSLQGKYLADSVIAELFYVD